MGFVQATGGQFPNDLKEGHRAEFLGPPQKQGNGAGRFVFLVIVADLVEGLEHIIAGADFAREAPGRGFRCVTARGPTRTRRGVSFGNHSGCPRGKVVSHHLEGCRQQALEGSEIDSVSGPHLGGDRQIDSRHVGE
jgi:hypothetical protein